VTGTACPAGQRGSRKATDTPRRGERKEKKKKRKKEKRKKEKKEKKKAQRDWSNEQEMIGYYDLMHT
jgi:hypothetical protein